MSELAENNLILALDIGTSSVRAAAYDASGKRLDETFVKNNRQLHVTDDGGAEIDAEEALAQIIQAVTDVLARTKEKSQNITHVAASCFWHSLVGVDAAGKALTPVYGWADTRSAKFAKSLQEKLDERAFHNRTGCRFHPSYWTAKLLWLKNTQPQTFANVDKWLSFGDFIALRFFGEAVASVSQASGTGLLDVRKCVWDAKLTEFIGINPEEKLPRLAADAETFGLNEKYGQRWPSLKSAKWFLSIGDGAANNIGANCVTAEKAALMIGTSGAMRVLYAGEPPTEIPFGLWCYRLDRTRAIIGGALSDGGGLYHWLKDTLKLTDTDDEIENQIAASTPDCHGLTFLPFLAGERSINWNPMARGAILGLSAATSALEITQAALEAVAYRFGAIFEELSQICSTEIIVASGGALRESPVWTQIICDCLNKKMTLPEEHEASSRGAILLALEYTGNIKNIADVPMIEGQAFAPDATKFEIYKQAKERQEKFYQLINSD